MDQGKSEFEELLNELHKENSSDLCAPDPALSRMLRMIVREVGFYAEKQISKIKRLNQIGVALSAEKNLNKLLETIVEEARKFANADGGTLYIMNACRKELRAEILQNATLKINRGGTSEEPVGIPPIPLMVDGKPNNDKVSAYAALTGETINIPDVYEIERFSFTGPKEFDKMRGYRTKSMLVVPMKNHENDITGVLQLINAADENGEIIPFYEQSVDLIASLASQAAVAIEKTHLVWELKNLLHAFIKSIAIAIDAKSPYTGGHIKRVVKLAIMIAEEMSRTGKEPFANVRFSEDQIEELRMAAWMHDLGKMTTPDHTLDKRTKLEVVFDGIELIRARYDMIGRMLENEHLSKKIAMLENGERDSGKLEKLDRELQEKLAGLREECSFIAACNTPAERMDEEKIARLKQIAQKTFILDGVERSYLTEDEISCLTIRQGTLTTDERQTIENHALMTYKILQELPFPKALRNVPRFAAYHHEKLDGSGYPFGLKGEQIPLEAKIMAVADIFEALTAPDRPYRKPMKLSQAIAILRSMSGNGIDPQIVELFIENGVHRQYAQCELRPDQIDDV